MDILIKLHLNSKNKLLNYDVMGTPEQRDFISKTLDKCIGWSIHQVPFRINLLRDQPDEVITFPDNIIILHKDKAYDI